MTGVSRWRLAGGALLALVLLCVFFWGVDWSALGDAFRRAQAVYLLGAAGVTVGVYVARAWRWGYLLSPLARVPFPRLFSATAVGFMTGLLIPRAGEVVRPYLIARRYEVRIPAAFASIILERLVDVITVLILFGLYLYAIPIPAAQTRGAFLGVLKLGGGLAGLAAAALILVLLAFHVHAERAMAVVDRLLGGLPARLSRPLSHGLRAFGEGLAVLQAPAGQLLAILAQSFLVWLLIALSIHLNNRAFGLDLPYHSAFLIIVFLTVGVAIPTPGMVGGFHESYLLAMTQAFGVDKATAAAAGIACHAFTNLPVLLLGLLLLGGEGLTVGKVTEMTEETPKADPPVSTDGPAGRQSRSARSVGAPAAEPGFTPGESGLEDVAGARTRISGVPRFFGGRGTPRLMR